MGNSVLADDANTHKYSKMSTFKTYGLFINPKMNAIFKFIFINHLCD